MARGSLKKVSATKWRGRIDVKSYDNKRKQVTETFEAGSQAEADKKFNAWVPEVQEKHSNAQDVTVKKLFAIWSENYCERQLKNNNLTSSTASWYGYVSKRIIASLGDIKIDSITFQDLEDFVAALEEDDLSKKYVYEHYNMLKTVLNYAVAKDLLNRNYLQSKEYTKALGFSKKKTRNKIQVFETDEEDIITREAAENKILAITINIIRLAGVRRGEALGLQLKHVDFRNDIIKIEQQLQKTGKKFVVSKCKTENAIRSIPMGAELRKILHDYIIERKKQMLIIGLKPSSEDFLIANELNQPVDPNLVTKWFRELMSKFDEVEEKSGRPAKWQGRGLHCLRHTFASNMIRAGVNIVDLSHILGHHSPAFTLEIYAHIFNDSKKIAVRKLEEFRAAQRDELQTANEL